MVVIQIPKTLQNFTVSYRGNHYDIYNFLEKHHPGGIKCVQRYEGKDITDKMQTFQHSKAAYYILREYKIGGRDERKLDGEEDLENSVDWEKPMLSQVGALGTRYKEWVMLPVDRKLILFGNPILEILTKRKLFYVPFLWLPVIFRLIFRGCHTYELVEHSLGCYILVIIMSLVFGFVLWTIVEYASHRWIFHFVPSGKYKIMIYLHFFLHGLHHKVPLDPRTTLLTPFPASFVAYLLYLLLHLLYIPESIVYFVVAGVIIGYFVYVMLHYYIHYGSPKENSYLHHLKRLHNQHHWNHQDKAFGLTCTFWDKLFGSLVGLKTVQVA